MFESNINIFSSIMCFLRAIVTSFNEKFIELLQEYNSLLRILYRGILFLA